MTGREWIPSQRNGDDPVGFDSSTEQVNLDGWMQATTLIAYDSNDSAEDHILRGIE